VWVYINYPNRIITGHPSSGCEQIRKHAKPDQRSRVVRITNLAQILADFGSDAMQWGASASTNDFWIDVSVGTADQDLAVVQVIHAILAHGHEPFSRAKVEIHDCAGQETERQSA